MLPLGYLGLSPSSPNRDNGKFVGGFDRSDFIGGLVRSVSSVPDLRHAGESMVDMPLYNSPPMARAGASGMHAIGKPAMNALSSASDFTSSPSSKLDREASRVESNLMRWQTGEGVLWVDAVGETNPQRMKTSVQHGFEKHSGHNFMYALSTATLRETLLVEDNVKREGSSSSDDGSSWQRQSQPVLENDREDNHTMSMLAPLINAILEFPENISVSGMWLPTRRSQVTGLICAGISHGHGASVRDC